MNVYFSKKTNKNLSLFFVASFGMSLLAGCTGMQKWVKDNPKAVLGIGAGLATGGLAGGLIGHEIGHTAGGLLIGSGLGGTVGGLIGSATEDRGTTRSRHSSPPSTNNSARPYSRYDSSVAELQKSLHSMGYDCGPIDGIMGPRTRKAIMSFQKDQRITVDGIAGPVTQTKMDLVGFSGYKEL
jgi:uncharacterized protein YcfJ